MGQVDGDLATIGITDTPRKTGRSPLIELPEIDTEIERDESSDRSIRQGGDRTHRPVGGQVVNVNDDLLDDVGIINSDPHDTGG